MSLGLSFCLTVCLSVTVLSVRPSVWQSVSLSVYVFVRSFFYLSVSVGPLLCVWRSFCSSVSISLYSSFCLSVCLSIQQSVYLSVYLSIRHSVCVCPTVRLSFNLSFCLSVLFCTSAICLTDNPSICSVFPFNILSVCFSGCVYHLIILSVF